MYMTKINLLLAILFSLILVACQSGGDNTNNVPATVEPFNGPLSSMDKAVKFNTLHSHIQHTCAACSPTSSIFPRRTDLQLKIDPHAQTVEIIRDGRSEVVFDGIDYINGDSARIHSRILTNFFSAERLTLLLPGPSASGLDYAGYGVWNRQRGFSALPFSPISFTTLDGDALSFGIPSKPRDMPRSGSATYKGFMDGYYATAPNDIWTLSGDAELTANFSSGKIFGQLDNIIANPGALPFGDIRIDADISGTGFTGAASSSGLPSDVAGSGALSGEAIGQFYGPRAAEIGGVFRMEGPFSSQAIGAFAAGQ